MGFVRNCHPVQLAREGHWERIPTWDREFAALPEPEVLRLYGHVYVSEPGVFVPFTRLGQFVSTGDRCGELVFPENPERAAIPIHFERSGVVVCQRHPARVDRGDCVAHLAGPDE